MARANTSTGLVDSRLAGAPISWGVCEVPGWGAQLPSEQVLAEMASLGLRATEAGPVGYLGTDPDDVAALLARHELRLVGGFLPVVLHEPAAHAASVAAARSAGSFLEAAGASLLISAVVVDLDWSPRVPLSTAQWQTMFDGLARLDEAAHEQGLDHVTHPHWGTLVQTDEDVTQLLEGSTVRLCLDTGHLVLGRTDPAWLARVAGDRIGHVHLKDVADPVADRLRSRELELVAAVEVGLFPPLGEGSAPIGETIRELESGEYEGWYVLEQDRTLASADPGNGTGPVEEMRRSLEFASAVLGGASARPAAEGG
jgi:inosose dehydratase